MGWEVKFKYLSPALVATWPFFIYFGGAEFSQRWLLLHILIHQILVAGPGQPGQPHSGNKVAKVGLANGQLGPVPAVFCARRK